MKKSIKRFYAIMVAALLLAHMWLPSLAVSPAFELEVMVEGEDTVETYSLSELSEKLGKPDKITLGKTALSGLGVVEFMRRLGMEKLSSEVSFAANGNQTDMKSLGQYLSDGDMILFTEGLKDDNPLTLYDASGQRWEGITGITAKPDYNFAIYPEIQGVRNIIPDGYGGAWIATTTGLFYLSAEGKAARMYEDKLDTQWVYDAALDAEGGLWVTQGFSYGQPSDMAKNRGIIHFSPSGEKLEQFTFESTGGKLPNNFVQTLAIDSEGNLWIGHFPGPNGEALTKYTPSTGIWKSWDFKDSGLASPSINTLLPDREGGIWLCGYPEYTVGASGAQLPPYSGGYSHIDAEGNIKSWKYSQPTHPELNSYYMGNFWSRAAAIDSKGGAYIVRSSGDTLAYFYNPAYGNLTIEDSKGGFVDYVSPDKAKTTVYTGRALSSIIDKGTFANLDPATGRPSSGATPEIRALDVDGRDGVWLGTAGLGVIYQPVPGQTLRHLSSRYFDWPSRNFQFNNIRVISIEPDGTVYIGSNGGLAVRRFESLAKVSPAPESFSVSSHRVLIDGGEVPVQAYNIDGSNYFKLRDLAYALKDTSKRFEIEWSKEGQTVNLLPGKAYTVAGNELIPGASGTLASSTHRLFVEGKKLYPDAYNIGGSNYFKLRDIAPYLGFEPGWDPASQTVTISTKN